MRFKQGKPVGPLKKLGAARGSGSSIYFHPDAAIFPKIEFDPEIIKARLEVASYLHKGLKVSFDDETTKSRAVFQHHEGIVDYLKKIVGERGAKPVHEAAFVLSKDEGLRLDLVLQWTEATDEHLRSYVNGIPTGSGGTHENGLRAGIGKAVRNFIETHNLTPRRPLTAEDIREGMTGVLSLFIACFAVSGSDQGSLNNPEFFRHRRRRSARPRALAQSQHQRGRSFSFSRIILAARASRSEPRGTGRVSRANATSAGSNLPATGRLPNSTAAARSHRRVAIQRAARPSRADRAQ
jgi:DNA gyrase subunit B/topoisomerase-4 subunit B